MFLFCILSCHLKAENPNISVQVSSEEKQPLSEVKFLPKNLSVSYRGTDASWINGTFSICSETPCGHINQTLINNRPVYVKKSGLSTDPNKLSSNGSPSWYWAYIFNHS